MTWIDWIIVAVVAGTVLGGLAQGFFRSVFGLLGLLAGVLLGAWNYQRVAARFFYLVKPKEAAEALGFCLVALVVMAIAFLLGVLLSRTAKQVGLGCLDRLAGAVFGFFQGIVLVTLGIALTLAFFPSARLLGESRLPSLLFDACHLSMHVTPDELSKRVREGLKELNEHSPQWMKPKNE